MTNATIAPTEQEIVAGYRTRLAKVREALAGTPKEDADGDYNDEYLKLVAEDSYLRLCILLGGPCPA